ncbi:MAG: helix-turn-helix domain-containing protein [Anaerolineae bacterium]|nr:helix-turn-helix domain-containing protein [Anaerolineae bacterium]
MSDNADITALGAELRDARQKRDLTLPDVERRIHIRQKYLEALEGGQVVLLPSPPQTRGFLRNYARFLGLDAEWMVSRWDEALAKGSGGRRARARRSSIAPVAPPPDPVRATQSGPVRGVAPSRTMAIPPALTAAGDPEPTARPRLRIAPLLFFVALIVLLVAALVGGGQFVQQYLASNEGQPGAPILSPMPGGSLNGDTLAETLSAPTGTAESPRPTALPNPNAPPGGVVAQNTEPTPSTPLPPAAEGEGDVSIQLEIVARTWLRVTVDGEVSYQGAPGPNTILQYRGNTIAIRASNGAGLHAIINNRDLGILGARGQIVDQTFTAGTLEQLAPTPTPSPELPALTESTTPAPELTATETPAS